MGSKKNSSLYYADQIQNFIEEEYKKFKDEQINNDAEEVFENSSIIYFYKEIHTFITNSDLCNEFEISELKKLADCGNELLALLYEEYLKKENFSVSSWENILELFDSFLK